MTSAWMPISDGPQRTVNLFICPAGCGEEMWSERRPDCPPECPRCGEYMIPEVSR